MSAQTKLKAFKLRVSRPNIRYVTDGDKVLLVRSKNNYRLMSKNSYMHRIITEYSNSSQLLRTIPLTDILEGLFYATELLETKSV